jgi:hypothetical protein
MKNRVWISILALLLLGAIFMFADGGLASYLRFGSSLPSGAPQYSVFVLTTGPGIYICNANPCTSSGQWVGAGAGTITGVTAGIGLSGGGTSGTVTLDTSNVPLSAIGGAVNGDCIIGSGGAWTAGLCSGSGGGSLGSTAYASVTPSNTNLTYIVSYTTSAGQFNTANKSFYVDSAGAVNITGATRGFEIGLCVNDGSGIQFLAEAAATNSVISTPWFFHVPVATLSTGTSGQLSAGGLLGINVSGGATSTMYAPGVVATVDLTKALTLGPCVQFSSITSSPSADASPTNAFQSQ